MEPISVECRHLVRGMLHAPVFSLVMILTLGVGVGGAAAVFSVVDIVLLKPLAYPNQDELVSLVHAAPGWNVREIRASASLYFTYREESRVFQDVGLWTVGNGTITGIGEPEQVRVLSVTDGTLPILGVAPRMGRWFVRAEDTPGGPPAIMLSEAYWQQRFGGASDVLGRRLTLDGTPREVVGILPARFTLGESRPSVLVPLQLDPQETVLGNFAFRGVARLKPGVTLSEANADVNRMISITHEKFPPPKGYTAAFFEAGRVGAALKTMHQDIVGDVADLVRVLVMALALLLVTATANITNLLLVRGEERRYDFAIREAIGATTWQRVRAFVLEGVALTIIGGMLAIALAYTAVREIRLLRPSDLPRVDEIAVDGRVMLFAALVSLVAGTCSIALAVLRGRKGRCAGMLREAGSTISHGAARRSVRGVLIAGEVALTLVMLIAGALLFRTLQHLGQVDAGFVSADVQTFGISIPAATVPDPERVVRMEQEMALRIASIQSVTAVGLTSDLPLDGRSTRYMVFAADRSYAETQLPPVRHYKFVSPGIVKAMGNRLMAGREFTWDDVLNRRQVALVSENMAREMWGDPTSAIGHRIQDSLKGAWREIVGVVADERDDGVNREAPSIVYWPILVSEFWGAPLLAQRMLTFVVRTPRAGTESFMKEVRQAVWSVDRSVPIADVQTLDDVYTASTGRIRFALLTIVAGGIVALSLALGGIYGIVAYLVTRRTREVAIRLALGAEKRRITWMFVREGLTLSVIGTGAGLVVAFWMLRVLQTLLFGIEAVDSATYANMAVAVIAMTGVVSYASARKASRVAPVRALQAD